MSRQAVNNPDRLPTRFHCNDLIKRYIQPLNDKMVDVKGDFEGSTNLNIPELSLAKIATFIQLNGMADALVAG